MQQALRIAVDDTNHFEMDTLLNMNKYALLLLITVFWQLSAAANVDDIATQYVKLVLAVGQHDPVYVDAYYGPESLKKEVTEASWPLAAIADKGKALKKALAALPSGNDLDVRLRVHYLKKQLTALIFHSEQFQKQASGKPFQRDFNQEAVALYDTLPPTYDYAYFDSALEQLDASLPGQGDLQSRIAALQEKARIPKDKLDVVFKAAMQGCREKTLEAMTLPENESFRIEYVQDKTWSGYNWYQGNANSLIQVNTDFPIYISRAIDLGCHEGYPGHHTYNASLESELVNKKGWLELSVYPLFSPQSLIAEGSANYGIFMAYPNEQQIQFEQQTLYPLAGLAPKHARQYHAFLQLKRTLSYAGNEVARDYINGVISREQAVELQAKYALEGIGKAEQRIRFVEKYGAYVINYNWGKDLVKDYIEAQADSHQDRWKLFSELLSSPRVPSSLSW
ncbi:MAG: hypothetical protein ACFHVJ_07545 [Aestuariibacter sp.]